MISIKKYLNISFTIVCLLMLEKGHCQNKIDLNWTFEHPVSKQVVDAGTHGSVQEKLIAKGELPDPFYGENEKLFNWIEDHLWTFNSTFSVTKDDLRNEFIELEFPGIDTYAEVYVNDSLIGFAENAFRPYFFDIKKYVQPGNNRIKLIFYPPVIYHKEMYKHAKYKLPAPNDLHEIAVAPYTRKPQYQFGWDWSMRMNTIGLLKPAKVKFYNTTRIESTNIVIEDIFEDHANLRFEINLKNPTSEKLFWKSELFGIAQFDGTASKLVREDLINNPILWWPRGHGNQHLYHDVWTLYNSKNEILYTRKVSFGIRKSELVMETDLWGTGYVIKVNDRPIFCKGADYIPQDIFPSRVSDKDLWKTVKTMAESNFNMVRVWGGGYYPDNAFFEACDSLGIMVWQDFMFACAMYPGDTEFLSNVTNELNYQIPRIASHPSVVIFNGNNEVDVAWKNWGFQVKYLLYGNDAKEIEEAYEKLFKTLIPKTLSSITNVPYIHTSPLSNWGKDEFYNHGSQHYWGVWHGKDPMENFASKIGRFNAEYGFQSFPEYSTLLSFSTKDQWDLNSDVMKHHQKSYVGNGMIAKHAKILYGEAKDFEEFVYFSQLTQATAVSMAVSGHRLDAPRCMGTLYWQLNDCWPAPTWSSIDYFGNWKALQYWIRQDYSDIAVLAKKNEQGKQEYYLVSDVVDTFMCEVNMKVFDLKGTELTTVNVSQLVKGNESEKICANCLEEELKGLNCVVQFDWKDNKGNLHNRTFSQLPTNYDKAEKTDIVIESIIVDETTKTAIVKVNVKKYVRNFWLYSNKTGVHFNDNFIDLLPGVHEFKITYDKVPDLSDFDAKWM